MQVSHHPRPGRGDPWKAVPAPAVAGRRRPWLAGLLSALLPGAGQAYAGRWRRALWFAVPAAALGSAAAAVASRGPLHVAKLVVQPRWLWALFAANVAVAVLRLGAATDAYRVAAWPRPARLVRTAGLAAALAVVAVPHAVVGAYTLDAIHLVDSVFVGDEVALSADVDPTAYQGPAPVAATVPTAAPPPSIIPAEPGSAAEARRLLPDADLNPYRPVIVAREAPMEDAPLAPIDPPREPERITVLLAGGDAGPDRAGLRTDTMMVATLDLVTGRAVVFGVPRNFGWVPLPHSFQDAFADQEREARVTGTEGLPGAPCRCFPDILNALRQQTINWTRTFPDAADPGMEALRATIEHMLGLPIDYYVLADMGGFVDLIDALGGVDVVVTKRVRAEVSPAFPGEPWIRIDLAPGRQHLHGRQALAYVRDRKASSDYTRMQRQRCLVRSVAAAADPLSLARGFPGLADAIRASASTNIPRSLLPDMIGWAAGLDLDDIATVALTAPRYAAGDDGFGHPRPNLPKIRAAVAEALDGGTPAGAETDGACG